MFKSHIGLHRYNSLNNSQKFGHFVLKQIWQHHVESMKKFSFEPSLTGSPQKNAQLASLLGKDMVSVSTGVQYKGCNIYAGDVLLGEHPGLVVDTLQAGSDFFLRLQILKLQKQEEFISFWQKDAKQKILPISLAGRSPHWWLLQENDVIRCIH